MKDILFKSESGTFSYRIAGICVYDGKVLLHKAKNDDGYAFPGGHVAFGETNEETLVREFKEETGADIAVGDLKWVAEIFFPLHNKPCHQICLYYMVYLTDEALVTSGNYQRFYTVEGKQYHHIIDPKTLMPKNTFSAVSIITDHSGMADAMSTALFNMTYEEGLAIAEKLEFEAIWVYPDGTVKTTDGFKELTK